MEKALGVGGIFVRARDPKALAEWYARALGIETFDDAGNGTPWMTEAESQSSVLTQRTPTTSAGASSSSWSTSASRTSTPCSPSYAR